MTPKKTARRKGTALYMGASEDESSIDDVLDAVNRLRGDLHSTEQTLKSEIASLRKEVSDIMERLEVLERNGE